MSSTGEPSGEVRSGWAGRFDVLLRSALALSTEHDPDRILNDVARCAAEVADARYAALGVYDADGNVERFVHHGVDAATVDRIGHRPEGRGLLGEVIVTDGPIRLADLTRDPRSCGFPAHHPAMRSFLGVPVRAGDRRYGNLYVAEKRTASEFDSLDEQLVATLAAFAAAAIEGARLVTVERERATARAELAATKERERARADILAKVIEAQEAERARVARDLHDQIGQGLTSVLLGLRLVDGALAGDQPDLSEVRARSKDVRDLVVDAMEQIRQLAFELRPTVLDDIGLVVALQRLVQDTSARSGLALELTIDAVDDETRLPAEVETVVYRVVQEALTNVCRHARASRASVELAGRSEGVRARVVDDGAGFDPDVVPLGSPGLTGMRERALLVGGSVEIVSAPGAGTSVALEVPVN
jgi:two-component system, NarL family, sensor histidine kinase DevS